ncbi:hypothetical protein GYMLUDRAFT_400274 [Collybiopsis luxurians FD-317 M1]|nr:hypothetical protein GYMLUDRAFT_400274 [Collybiopsis luxurians FD-317 M1]
MGPHRIVFDIIIDTSLVYAYITYTQNMYKKHTETETAAGGWEEAGRGKREEARRSNSDDKKAREKKKKHPNARLHPYIRDPDPDSSVRRRTTKEKKEKQRKEKKNGRTGGRRKKVNHMHTKQVFNIYKCYCTHIPRARARALIYTTRNKQAKHHSQRWTIDPSQRRR